ncbi:hypothetical protein GWI33_016481 [Rhynchophorus ferrugineus]|uniref:Chitin-binding type-2 domain-containing protein n=1 Tax=Rhynchophorus ferrugineus TaxID=354439 RepID=A0A834HXY6_RHYFE|nr:hypothetical protein GWI33_016481 [Rhynchophorus ferrugineus]
MYAIQISSVLVLCLATTYAFRAPLCPEDNSIEVYYPSNDCSKFWQCSNGVPVLQRCPADTLFNSDLNVCDNPESVVCPAPKPSTTTRRPRPTRPPKPTLPTRRPREQ